MRKEQQLMLKHDQKIWKGADNRYCTNIYVDGKRKQIKRKSKAMLIETLIDFYYPQAANLSVINLYDGWREHRKIVVNSDSTIKRNDTDWVKYYLNDECSRLFISKDMQMMTKIDILQWFSYLIKKYEMDKKIL